MTIRLPMLAAMLAVAAAAVPAVAQPAAPRLTPEQQTLLHCSATFALVSGRQHAGEEAALAFPDVTARGREYFVRAMAQLMDEAGLGREQVVALVTAEGEKLQGDPAGLFKGMPACLASLEASGL